ncbi:MAG: monovalent cation/H+ antiporter complex subunit F [Oscillospiraceae bacterium]
MEAVDRAYEILFVVTLLIFGVLMAFSLVRAIKGPRVADRIMGINLISTMIVIAIAILSVCLGQGYLLDVSLIYAMISFLAVVVLARVYIIAHRGDDDEVYEEDDEDDT